MVLQHQKSSMTMIVITFLIAFYLSIVPMPEWAEGYRPPWVSLVLLFWCIAVPDRVGVASGWLVGISLDALSGVTLGENALTMAVLAWITLHIYKLLRVFPIWQQALVILAMLLLQNLLSFWIRSSFDQMPNTWVYWAPPLIGAVIWPWLYIMMSDVQRRLRVG